MKTAGIILIVIGGISTIGAIIGASHGQRSSFLGIGLLVLGIYLISRANKKKEEEEKKNKWEEASRNE